MSLNLRIVSPEKVEFVGQVDRVVVPGTSGEFEILANHAPIISTLNNGRIAFFTQKASVRKDNGAGPAERNKINLQN